MNDFKQSDNEGLPNGAYARPCPQAFNIAEIVSESGDRKVLFRVESANGSMMFFMSGQESIQVAQALLRAGQSVTRAESGKLSIARGMPDFKKLKQ